MTACDGDIGFISDKRGGDWSKTYANLDPDIDPKELATLISIPDNPSRHMGTPSPTAGATPTNSISHGQSLTGSS